jgi:hypothetical protein
LVSGRGLGQQRGLSNARGTCVQAMSGLSNVRSTCVQAMSERFGEATRVACSSKGTFAYYSTGKANAVPARRM